MRSKGEKLGVYVIFLIMSVAVASWVYADEASCAHCGMKKAMFGHSWVTIEREDGSKAELCSVHCAGLDMALHIDQPVRKVMVGDYNSKKPIAAETAYWVIGGSKPGVMTKRAKWAFEDKASADAFIKQNGGESSTYEQAMKAGFADMYEDTAMIQAKRKMMMNQKKE